jgi:hypothetical protein
VPIINRVWFVPYSGTPQYKDGHIYIAMPMDQNTLAHELVHAYNDLMNTGLQNDDVRDEGIAYGFVGLLEASFSASVMEHGLQANNYCEAANSGMLKRMWQSFWSQYGDPKGYVHASVYVPYHGEIDEPLDSQDFDNLRTLFGFHLSCKEFAQIINSKLGACCFTVSCNQNATNPFEIPAGVKIHKVFQ